MTCVEQSTNGAPQCRSQTGQQEPSRRQATTGQRSCVRPLWTGGGLITRKQCLNYELAWRSLRFKRGATWAWSVQAHCGGRVVPCYSFSQDFERHSGLRSAQLSGPLVIPLLKACCHLMPQRSHASYAALLSAQKGEKLAGRKCEKWGKTGWGVGVRGGFTIFLVWLLHCFQLKHVQKDFINGNHCNNGKTKCLPLACNSCNGFIYLRLIKCMSLHQNSNFNNIDKTKRRQNSPPYNKMSLLSYLWASNYEATQTAAG